MRTCPVCRKESSEEFRFCPHCGATFELDAPAREVRKTVTIVFSDVTGSTALGERLDPESMRRAMGRYFDEMRTVLERHGGTVEKFIGDAVMAVFGIPQLHEDDALRAVRAAAEMRDALTELNAELEQTHGVRIETRTGVNTGEVVAGEGQTLATGDAVNVAARLEQTAAPGEILIGDPTFRLVRDAVEVESVEPLALKGKAETVVAHRLVAVFADTLGHARRLDASMVGRETERRRLRDAFEQAVRDHSCQLFTVLGSAGVGKSRLVAEFLVDVDHEAVVVRGRCLPYGEGITYWPVAEAVKEAAQLTEEDTAERAHERIAALLQREESAEPVAARLAEVLGLAPVSGGGTEESFWAVRKLFEALARRRPLVAVFDDVHWAEPTFLDLIEDVADWSRGAPILLLCLARPELLDARPTWGGGKLNATSVLLEPLSDDESGQLIANLLGRAELAPDVRGRIAEAAEGNPLFVEELLGMLIDDGLLSWSDGAWEPAADLSTLAIPPTIQVLLAARLDRLESEERAVIERASVEGKVFHRGSIAELSHETARPAVGSRLLTLVRKELIRPDRAAFAGEDAFRFRHLLIRDAAYNALPKEARAELHERFAAWLERKADDRFAEYEEIIGYHLERAFRYREELGPVDEDARRLGERAATLLAESGRRAYARSDDAAAVKLLFRAAELTAESRPRLEILVDLAAALWEAGELARVEQVVDQALELSTGAGDTGHESHARVRGALVQLLAHTEQGSEEARRTSEDAIVLFERLGDDRGLASAWQLLGFIEWQLAHFADARQALERAASYARAAGDERLELETESMILASISLGPTPVPEAIRAVEEVLERHRGDPVREFHALGHLCTLTAMSGSFVEARGLMQRTRTLAADVGGLAARSGILESFGHIELLMGDASAAEREWREEYEFLEQIGDRGHLSTVATFLGRALLEQGRDDEADQLSRISEDASASDDLASQMGWRAVRARALARRGELEEAVQLAEEAVALSADTDMLDFRADTLVQVAEVLRLAGRVDDAASALGEAERLCEQKGNVAAAGNIRVLLAAL